MSKYDVSFYPELVNRRFCAPNSVGAVEAANGCGRAASFICGSAISLTVRVNENGHLIENAGLMTNGCGFAIAAADVLCDWLRRTDLRELHGLDVNEMSAVIFKELHDFPVDRVHCSALVIDAVKIALADHRERRIEEFQGEKALICTCFGVSEETIAAIVANNPISGVNEISELCNAGAGCGSCRMLIQEMIDAPGDA